MLFHQSEQNSYLLCMLEFGYIVTSPIAMLCVGPAEYFVGLE